MVTKLRRKLAQSAKKRSHRKNVVRRRTLREEKEREDKKRAQEERFDNEMNAAEKGEVVEPPPISGDLSPEAALERSGGLRVVNKAAKKAKVLSRKQLRRKEHNRERGEKDSDALVRKFVHKTLRVKERARVRNNL